MRCFAPVVTRFITYHVPMDAQCAAYCSAIMKFPLMQEWIAGALSEPELTELEVEF
jgi:glutathione S-transferase